MNMKIEKIVVGNLEENCYVVINDKKLTNYLIGLSDENFKLNGIDCLLNYQIREDI